ncbi:MAG TPA: uroporphyrinogen decarboxylase [Crocinitomix sp.]|nr:uroporphyrinogen decarboxylase [Crocinitomix sp.]
MEFLGLSLVDWIGYSASALLLISMMMKNIIRLRIINSLGCILFVIMGLMINNYPIVITNGAIILINMYYLFIKKK